MCGVEISIIFTISYNNVQKITGTSMLKLVLFLPLVIINDGGRLGRKVLKLVLFLPLVTIQRTLCSSHFC